MPTHVCIVAPNGKLGLVDEVLGFDMTAQPDVFTAADPVVRRPTHKKLAGSMTTAQRSAVDAWVEDPPTDDADPRWGVFVVRFEKVLGQPSPLAGILSANGLTDSNGALG